MSKKLNLIWKNHSDKIDQYLLCALIFLLPLERIPSIDFGGVTIRLSFIIASLIIARAFWILIKYRSFKPSIEIKILNIFIIWMILLMPIAINFTRSIEVFIFTTFTILAAISVAIIYKKENLEVYIKALLISASIVAIFGIYQYIGNILGLSNSVTGLRDRYSWQQFGFPRIQSTALEPLYYASYMLIPLLVTAALLLRKGKTLIWPNHILILVIMLTTFSASIFLTVSRGGILALIVSAAALILAYWIKRITTLRRTLIAVMALILGMIIAWSLIKYFNKPPDNPLNTGGKTGSSAYTQQLTTTGLEGGGDERAQTRREAITIIKQNPRNTLIGIGPGQFGPAVQNNQKGGGWFIVNNLTLEVLVDYGIIGFSILISFFVALFISGIRYIAKSKDKLSVMATAALLAYLVSQAIQYQTFSTLYIMHIWVAIGLLLAITKPNVKKA